MGTFLKTTMGKKTQELRQKDKKELETLLEEHREQLAQLRIEQQSSGNATKLSKIREVRKSVARIQTVINQETLHQVRKKYQKGKDARHARATCARRRPVPFAWPSSRPRPTRRRSALSSSTTTFPSASTPSRRKGGLKLPDVCNLCVHVNTILRLWFEKK